MASGIRSQDTKIRSATFLTVVGSAALDIIEGLPFGPEKREDIQCILDRLQTFCVGETNEIYER